MSNIGLLSPLIFTMTTIVWVVIFQSFTEQYGSKQIYD